MDALQRWHDVAYALIFSKWSHFRLKTGDLTSFLSDVPIAFDNKFQADPLIYCLAWRAIKAMFFFFLSYLLPVPVADLIFGAVDIQYYHTVIRTLSRNCTRQQIGSVFPTTLSFIRLNFCVVCLFIFENRYQLLSTTGLEWEKTKIERIAQMKTNIHVAVNAKNHIRLDELYKCFHHYFRFSQPHFVTPLNIQCALEKCFNKWLTLRTFDILYTLHEQITHISLDRGKR